MLLSKLKNLPTLIPSSVIPRSNVSTKAPRRPPREPSPDDFMVQYLTTSLGFSLAQALKSSAGLTHIRSPQNPDSVVAFFRSAGLTTPHIKTLISWQPRLLCADLDKTLNPRLNALKLAGFDGQILTQIIRSNPRVFWDQKAVPRLQFWRGFFGHSDESLLKALKRNRNVVNYDIEKSIMPKIRFLRSLGFSNEDIAGITMRINGFVLRRQKSMGALIDQTRELGFPRCGGGMFVEALLVVGMLKGDTLGEKLELLKSLGLSRDEVLAAFKRDPKFVMLSEKNLRLKMEFLIGEAGCDASDIARNPTLLGYSLQKRLVPRNLVLKKLREKELGRKNWDFGSTMRLPEDKFVKRFILRHEDEVPDLYKNYVDACAGN